MGSIKWNHNLSSLIVSRISTWATVHRTRLDPKKNPDFPRFCGEFFWIDFTWSKGRNTLVPKAVRCATFEEITFFFCWTVPTKNPFEVVMPQWLKNPSDFFHSFSSGGRLFLQEHLGSRRKVPIMSIHQLNWRLPAREKVTSYPLRTHFWIWWFSELPVERWDMYPFHEGCIDACI